MGTIIATEARTNLYRLIYQVLKEKRVIKVLRLWSHYECRVTLQTREGQRAWRTEHASIQLSRENFVSVLQYVRQERAAKQSQCPSV